MTWHHQATWPKHVEYLRNLIVECVEGRDLDACTVLRILQGVEMGNALVSATEEYQRLCAVDIMKKLAHAAEQQRCSWMRSELASAADCCKTALEAHDWHENEKKENEAS